MKFRLLSCLLVAIVLNGLRAASRSKSAGPC